MAPAVYPGMSSCLRRPPPAADRPQGGPPSLDFVRVASTIARHPRSRNGSPRALRALKPLAAESLRARLAQLTGTFAKNPSTSAGSRARPPAAPPSHSNACVAAEMAASFLSLGNGQRQGQSPHVASADARRGRSLCARGRRACGGTSCRCRRHPFVSVNSCYHSCCSPPRRCPRADRSRRARCSARRRRMASACPRWWRRSSVSSMARAAATSTTSSACPTASRRSGRCASDPRCRRGSGRPR
jgi:hypothetical protein